MYSPPTQHELIDQVMAWSNDSCIWSKILSIPVRYLPLEEENGVNELEDYLYLVPAATFSFTLILSSGVYVLHILLQCYRHRRRGGGGAIRTAESRGLNFTVRNFPRVAVIAGLIVLERIIYRHAYPFALGLELVLIKVLVLWIAVVNWRLRYLLRTCYSR